MNYDEFTQWLDAAQIAFPNLGTWIASLPNSTATMQLWQKTLETTNAYAAAEVIIDWHRTGERPVKWEDWPWSVKNEAFQKTRKPDPLPEARPPEKHQAFPERLRHVARMLQEIDKQKQQTDYSDPVSLGKLHAVTETAKNDCLKAAGL